MKWIIVTFVISLVALTLAIICLVRREKFSTGTDCGDKSTVLVLDGDNIGLKPIAEELQCLIQQELAKEKVVKYGDSINIARGGWDEVDKSGTLSYKSAKLFFASPTTINPHASSLVGLADDDNPFVTDQFKSWTIEKDKCQKSPDLESLCNNYGKPEKCEKTLLSGDQPLCFWAETADTAGKQCHAYDCDNKSGTCYCPGCVCENGVPLSNPVCQSLGDDQNYCSACDDKHCLSIIKYGPNNIPVTGANPRLADTKTGFPGFKCILGKQNKKSDPPYQCAT